MFLHLKPVNDSEWRANQFAERWHIKLRNLPTHLGIIGQIFYGVYQTGEHLLTHIRNVLICVPCRDDL